MPSTPIPRLPVLGWSTFSGAAEADTPCVLSLPGLTYTTSGRASILLALEALGVGPGDEVLVPTYHCPTMVAPVVHLKATPKFYPIDDTAGPLWAWLSSQDLSRVRVLLVAHFFGLPQPMAAVRKWCDDHRIALIEDCAHALFGKSGDRAVGAWGDLAIASLTKFLPIPSGGCLISNVPLPPPQLSVAASGSRLLLDTVEVGAKHGRLTGLNGLITTALGGARRAMGRTPPKPEEPVQAPAPESGGVFGIDAALAHRALPGAGRWLVKRAPRERIVSKRRERYQQDLHLLSNHTGLRPLIPELPAQCAPYVFPLWVDKPDPGYAELRSRRMPVSRWDWLWPGVPSLSADHGVPWSSHVLQLACHQDLTEADVETFAQVLLDLYKTPSAAVAKSASEPAALQGA